MSRYWPDGLELSDTDSPMEILRNAQDDWETSGGGVLALVLQETQSQSGYEMIVVHAKHVTSNRTASLFSVLSRKDNPYPVRLQPKEDELPKLFRQSYKTTKSNPFAALTQLKEEKWVTNEWVADTPGEFRIKLEEAFNLGNIKSEILNLISVAGDLEAPAEEEDDEAVTGDTQDAE